MRCLQLTTTCHHIFTRESFHHIYILNIKLGKQKNKKNCNGYVAEAIQDLLTVVLRPKHHRKHTLKQKKILEYWLQIALVVSRLRTIQTQRTSGSNSHTNLIQTHRRDQNV